MTSQLEGSLLKPLAQRARLVSDNHRAHSFRSPMTSAPESLSADACNTAA